MKKCYIGVGGVGCRALKEFVRFSDSDGVRFLYVDSDKRENHEFDDSDERVLFENYPYGTGCLRALGRDMFRHSLYKGEFPDVVDDFFDTDEAELRFITTTFGGFGSAVVLELADYISARIKKIAGDEVVIRTEVIAFTQEFYRNMFPAELMKIHEMNTVEFMNEFNVKAAKKSVYFPEVSLYAVYSDKLSIGDFPKVIGYDSAELKVLDTKCKYDVHNKKESHDVFISYSTKDQHAADLLADELGKRGVSTWIATRNMTEGSFAKQIVAAIRAAKVFVVLISRDSINSPHVLNEIDKAFSRLRDGIKIMPFLIDDTELNDECDYYLCRQEWFDGKNPPLEEKVRVFAELVKSAFDA
ncbi:MAG: TIR domain-containing protein [Oscillospiraceae bacterium]|nr:TIR domain-containing protein [Oscillospiraceae bacterium]